MVAKPSEKTILQTYSLNELLDLIKEKARIDAEEQMDMVRQHLSTLSKAMGGAFPKSTPGIADKIQGRRGRPRKDDSESASAPAAGRGGRKKTPLGQLLQQVLGPEPMGIEEIMEGLKAQGYKSKSKDPRRVLYLELKKQVENKNIKKSGRGMYALK